MMNKGNSIDRTQCNCINNCCSSGVQPNKKRFSLQVPLDDCMLNCSVNTHSDASSCSNNQQQQQRRGMIKSATMNMPIIMQQQLQQPKTITFENALSNIIIVMSFLL